MENMSNLPIFDWPKPHQTAPRASWPRYSNNAITRDHLAGQRLSPAVLKIEMERLRTVWQQVQRSRERRAVYDFLETAYGLVSKFHRAGSGERLLRKLHRLDRKLKRIQEPYSAAIKFGTEHKLDGRTRSKWALIMRTADRMKKRVDQLEDFIRAKGGINGCAAWCRKRK